jgi:hypothetical protein
LASSVGDAGLQAFRTSAATSSTTDATNNNRCH